MGSWAVWVPGYGTMRGPPFLGHRPMGSAAGEPRSSAGPRVGCGGEVAFWGFTFRSLSCQLGTFPRGCQFRAGGTAHLLTAVWGPAMCPQTS